MGVVLDLTFVTASLVDEPTTCNYYDNCHHPLGSHTSIWRVDKDNWQALQNTLAHYLECNKSPQSETVEVFEAGLVNAINQAASHTIH